MLCDRCLLYLERGLNKRVRELFHAYRNIGQEDPSIKALVAHSALSQYHVREGLMTLRGAGLVWGDYYYTLSPNGARLVKLLATADRPEPAEALCDECLLEIAGLLPGDAYDILAQLTHTYRTTQQLVTVLGISKYKLREYSFMLQGARLVHVGRGRNYQLTGTGRRLGLLLQSCTMQRLAAMPT